MAMMTGFLNLTILWVSLVCILHGAHAQVKCYQCISSVYSSLSTAPHLTPQANCGDNFDASGIETCTGTYCVEIKGTLYINGARVDGVARGCLNSTTCQVSVSRNDIVTCCQGKLCNSSAVNASTPFVITLCLLFIKLIMG